MTPFEIGYEQTTCTACGGKALYHSYGKGYCTKHKFLARHGYRGEEIPYTEHNLSGLETYDGLFPLDFIDELGVTDV